jgi:hypothetical protein
MDAYMHTGIHAGIHAGIQGIRAYIQAYIQAHTQTHTHTHTYPHAHSTSVSYNGGEMEVTVATPCVISRWVTVLLEVRGSLCIKGRMRVCIYH